MSQFQTAMYLQSSEFPSLSVAFPSPLFSHSLIPWQFAYILGLKITHIQTWFDYRIFWCCLCNWLLIFESLIDLLLSELLDLLLFSTSFGPWIKCLVRFEPFSILRCTVFAYDEVWSRTVSNEKKSLKMKIWLLQAYPSHLLTSTEFLWALKKAGGYLQTNLRLR